MVSEHLKDYIVYTENLNKNFHNFRAVKDVNLRVKRGEIFGIIGADGAGKTSIIQMICGLLPPSSGVMFVDGHNVEKEPDVIRSRIGYMSQNFTLYLDMSVEENIDFVGKLKGMSDQELTERKNRLLSFSRMAPFRDRKAGDLSGGMKKKLGLCCALIHKPAVLILDEPTTAVDPISRGDLWRIIYEFIVQGITVIIATPYMDEAERCHKVALMQTGKMLICDSPEKLKRLVKKTVFTCKSKELNRACSLLNDQSDFRAQIYGDQMRIFMPENTPDLKPVKALLGTNSDLSIFDIKKASTNMDDVYMELLAGNEDNGTKKIGWIGFNLSEIKGKSIKVTNVTKMFKDFTAVDNVSFEIEPGSIFGMLGPNGAGKTTLIKIMCGLLPPTKGAAQVAGFDIATQSRLVKNRVGYMSQLFSLYPDLTVDQNLDLYASIYSLSRQEKQTRKGWAIELSGLKGKEKYITADLVGGWRQKLALGCSVMHQPLVLFLDEPTSGVDPVARQEFWDVIYRFSEEGMTVVVTTHFMDEADRCHILSLMNAGKLIAMGPPESLKENLPTAFYELTSTATLESYDRLRSLDFLGQVALFGEKLHVSSILEAVELEKRILGNRDLKVNGLISITPMLEDVFIHHVIESEQDNKS
jgi:ABC-2 type transport system ATP-binding protein